MAVNKGLSAKSFENMITERGVPVKWERAQRCTCWDMTSGQPGYSCKACNGDGYVYDEPIEESAILIQSLIMSKDFTHIGEYRMGDAVATVPYRKRVLIDGLPDYVENKLYWVGEWDRITLMNTEFRSDEILVRGESLYGREPDKLRNEEITRIVSVLQADTVSGKITFYTPEVDFVLENGRIEWLGEAVQYPIIGEKYSVQYYHRPTYQVYTQLPQHRDQDNQHFPKKVILRYKDVI